MSNKKLSFKVLLRSARILKEKKQIGNCNDYCLNILDNSDAIAAISGDYFKASWGGFRNHSVYELILYQTICYDGKNSIFYNERY